MIEREHIEAIHDSISASLPLLRQLAENSNPEPYTIENLELTKFNIIISIFALICSLIGAYYGWRGYVMSKMTAVNVERIKPFTQRRLIIEYLRYVLAGYLRTIIIREKDRLGQKPAIQYVASLSLPEYNDFYYKDRFEQFKGCKIFRLDDKPVKASSFVIIPPKRRRTIEEESARKATLEIKRISMDIQLYANLQELLLSNTKKEINTKSSFFNTMIEKINDIALRNIVILSFIDEDHMCQCNYRLGREAILDYFLELDDELDGTNIEKDRLQSCIPIAKELFDNNNSFFYKLLNNEFFIVESYLMKSEKWKQKNIHTKTALMDYLTTLIARLLVIQSEFY